MSENIFSKTPTIDELLSTLEDGIAAPVARHLNALLLEEDQKGVNQILKKEGFTSKAERKLLYDYLLEKTRGIDVELVELPRSEWAGAFTEGNYPLVRYGQRFMSAYRYKESHSKSQKEPVEHIYFGSELVELKKVHQVWATVPRKT